MSNFQRHYGSTLRARLVEPRRFIQVIAGPRQVGKTTLVRQVVDALAMPAHYATADDPTLRSRSWIGQQWEIGRINAREASQAVLILDEIQKIPDWSEVVKLLWDEDTAAGRSLHVVLLGSAPLLLARGLGESLAGRFETIRLPHWSFAEMRDAFGLSLEQFLYFGGYPGAAPLIGDQDRWARYILDSLVETAISRDVLLMTRVDKPALLRRTFQLACTYSGQVLSYQKMVGQLQNAGNTTTLAHYLDLLAGAGLVAGLAKFAGEVVRQRGSSPKLQVFNTALMTSQGTRSLADAQRDREFWGRLVESAVGAHLLNGAFAERFDLHYWLDRNREVDFVVKSGDRLVAIEVKSGRSRDFLPGLAAFTKDFGPDRALLVGGQGIGIEEFLATPPTRWLS